MAELLSLELHLRSDQALLSALRRLVASCCACAVGDPDVAARVEVAAFELAENAVRHAVDHSVAVGLSLEPGKVVRMRFSNRAEPRQLDELKARFVAMKRYPSPLSYYLALMDETAGKREGSGLGLARVLAETDTTLSLEVEGERATIWAETKINGSRP